MNNDSPSRKSYSAKFKREVLKYFDLSGNNMADTATFFRIAPNMVCKWNKMSGAILSFESDCRRIGNGRSPQFPDLELAVYEWLTERRKKRLVVKYAHIKSYAKRKAGQMKLDVSNFKFSHGWINK